VTQAILLVGGQGTRLRPLTNGTPKPMLPVAGYPCTEHQIARAREAGVTRIVLGTSYRASVFEEYFSRRPATGVEIVYAVENEPLGTGGAIRHAAEYLTCDDDEPVVVFNGDILTGLDIPALIEAWRNADADVAIYLTTVDDPRAYGLVPTDAQGNVLAFTEKPQSPEEIVTNQINAGCYVFRRAVIDEIARGRVVSVERETFPALLARGAKVIGVVDNGYWLDLGTPLSFAQGSVDLVSGFAPSPLLVGRTGDSLIDGTASVSATATVGQGSYIGPGVAIGAGAVVTGSVIYRNAVIAPGARVEGSIIGASSIVGDRSVIREAVIADAVRIGSDNEILSGMRVFPGATIADTTLRFSSDR
jgi:mannose-1-phosphate guanylyltransferase